MTYNEMRIQTGMTDYRKAFTNALQGRADLEGRLADGTIAGACLLPNDCDRVFEDTLKKYSVLRSLATVFTGYDKASKIWVSDCSDTAGFVTEGSEIPVLSNDDAFDKYSVGSYKMASFMKLSREFMCDSGFDTADYVVRRLAKSFARAENSAFILGTGSNEPTGLLHDTEGAATGVTADSLTFDSVISLFFSVLPEYRENGVWLMNDSTALALRKLKESCGYPLWNHTDDTILGKPVIICNSMPDAESGKKAIAFGDMSSYWIIDRSPVTLKTLTERYALNDQIGYIGTRFLDGRLIRRDAVKVLQLNGTEE